jgi:hypothetical protein
MPSSDLATSGLSVEAKQRIRLYACRPDQMAFFHVVPSETGLSRTIWVSQNQLYPALIISPAIGRAVEPPDDAVIVALDEAAPFDDVNEWLRDNRDLLSALARQEIDVGDFYDGMHRRDAS